MESCEIIRIIITHLQDFMKQGVDEFDFLKNLFHE